MCVLTQVAANMCVKRVAENVCVMVRDKMTSCQFGLKNTHIFPATCYNTHIFATTCVDTHMFASPTHI